MSFLRNMRICLLTIVLLVVALVFVLEWILSRLEPTAVHPVFYIFAHPDDMVLFMASNVLMDARRAGNRVIAIQVCAGDGSVEWPDEWWQAREHGIDWAMLELSKEYTPYSVFTLRRILNFIVGGKSFGVNTNTYVFPDSNYFSYYNLRVPDNALATLFNGSSIITRGPNPVSYETVRELADVIERIIMSELVASGQLSPGTTFDSSTRAANGFFGSIWIHTIDPKLFDGTGTSNPDHYHVGTLVEKEIVWRVDKQQLFSLEFWRDYSLHAATAFQLSNQSDPEFFGLDVKGKLDVIDAWYLPYLVWKKKTALITATHAGIAASPFPDLNCSYPRPTLDEDLWVDFYCHEIVLGTFEWDARYSSWSSKDNCTRLRAATAPLNGENVFKLGSNVA